MNLSVADNQDGSGITATISGSSGGSVSFFYQLVTDDSWTEGGSRTGNGNIAVELTDGFYWGYALDGSTLSNVVYFSSTTADDSVHYRCLLAAQARIQSLNIFDVDSVRVRKLPLDRGFKPDNKDFELPAVILSPMGQETMGPATNLRDDVAYPVVITLIFKHNVGRHQELEQDIEPFLKVRERLARAFRSQRLNGVPEIYMTNVEANSIYSPEAFSFGVWAGFMTLKFVSREVRGL